MSGKWTQGPWEAVERGAYSDFDGNSRIILGDDMRIAVVQTDGREETEANAALIAASPDMAEALIEVEPELSVLAADRPGYLPLLAKVRAALALTRIDTDGDGEQSR